jgi:iron(III) transport system substrate-binding protein
LALAVAFSADAEAKTVLKVYTALEEEHMPIYEEAFEKANPDIDIQWQRDSTGVITARLLAEKDNRQADVVWGLAATSLMLLDKNGMLDAYKPQGFDQIKDQFKDTRAEGPTWVGMDAWAAAICYNTAEGERLGIPAPAGWARPRPADRFRHGRGEPAPTGLAGGGTRPLGGRESWAFRSYRQSP